MLYNIDINKMNKLMSNNEDARQIIPQLLRNHRNTISTISHEIRNPLTLVSSALQVMEKQNPELKDIPHWSQVMGDVDFIIQLLEELSAFNSSNELYYSVFSIEQLLKNVAISFAISLDTNEADIEFSSSISDSLGEFTGDKIKLQELVLNLLKNAEEAITEQGSIHLAGNFFYRWIGGWKTHPADPGSESKNSFQWNHAAPWEVEIPENKENFFEPPD